MKRVLVFALSSAALIASPVAGQSLTLGSLKAPIARASGQKPAKSIKDLWAQINALPTAKPPVGDAVEPELGKNLDNMPAYVASNFNADNFIVPAWGNGSLPSSSANEGVGAFRFFCSAGQVIRDDPVVFPGQPGKSHLHQFFGNTAANAYSTYESLRTKGDSTCMNPLNRSAYWIPAMLDGKGNVVRPDYVSIYYKRPPEGGKDCVTIAKACMDLPRGLRFIFGWDMIRGNPPTGSGTWACDGPVSIPGTFRYLDEVQKICPVGNRIYFTLGAPNCYDGKHLDSPDHRSHLAYASYGDTGQLRCPSTHPYLIPSFSISAFYYVSEPWTEAAPSWSLSSDDMTAMGMGKMRPGLTLHSDWFGAWDEPVMQMWNANCINKLLSCNGGDLGNGRQLKDVSGFDWVAHPRKVAIPPAS